MGVDWGQVVANNASRETERRDREAVEGIQRGNPALAADEARWLAGRRAEEAATAEIELHQAELHTFHKFASDQIAALSRPGHENPRTAAEWDRVRTEVCLGRWPDSFVLRADPVAALKFQSLRVRLAPKPGDGPQQTRVPNSMFVWGK